MTVLTLCFGLAIFLYAMHELESGIQLASGDSLKRWIAERTSHPLSSAGYGILVTAILQSSSMVSLVVLAFVSAGIMPLYNGIGVVLGANLGTTVTGWVVTVVGFKMNLQALVIPLLGAGAALSLVYRNDRKLNGLGQALFAFGLLIFGLNLMKDSVSGLSQVIDLAALRDMPAWVYLLAGMTMAAIMQSSSAVMIIILSLLHSGFVGLTDAAAVVIGADLGTTSTTVLGSLGQSVVKKQLAFAHVFFNLSVNTMAFFFLLPTLPLFLDLLSIEDPLFGLVAFHSTFNLAGLIVFLPALKVYTRWIQSVLVATPEKRAHYFDVPVEVADAALDSLNSALGELNQQVVSTHLHEFEISSQQLDPNDDLRSSTELSSSSDGDFVSRYESLKKFEGELIRYAGKLRHTQLSSVQDHNVSQIVESARALIYATKTLKDVRADFQRLRDAAESPLAVELSKLHQDYLLQFFRQLLSLRSSVFDKQYVIEQCVAMHELNTRHHEDGNNLVTQHLTDGGENFTQVSTWFNLNHELHHYSRYMISAPLELVE